MREIKSVLLFAAGVCWLLFAAVIGLILVGHLTGGAGMQVFGFLSPLTVTLGVGQVIGFVAAALVCFAIGMLLCLHGLIPAQVTEEAAETDSIEEF